MAMCTSVFINAFNIWGCDVVQILLCAMYNLTNKVGDNSLYDVSQYVNVIWCNNLFGKTSYAKTFRIMSWFNFWFAIYGSDNVYMP